MLFAVVIEVSREGDFNLNYFLYITMCPLREAKDRAE